MSELFQVDNPVFRWGILPFLIFCARILDVSIGTLRIAYIARGQKIIAPVLGFFEVILWLVAIVQIFKHLNNAAAYIAYAGGFAAGNYVGMYLEQKLAIGMQIVRIITRLNARELAEHLISSGYSVTRVDAQGSRGPVEIIFSLIKRRDLPNVIRAINQYNPNAFYTVEDVQLAREGVVPLPPQKQNFFNYLLRKMDRKRK
jgi:uncharacterized protein YebE (UPF0316 family)